MAKNKNVSLTSLISKNKSLKSRLKTLYFNDLFNMVCNAILIKDKPEEIPERWIKDKLLLNGEIDVFNGEWLEYCGNNGYFVYGEPTEIFLKTANNLSIFKVPANQVSRIGANHLRTAPINFLNMQIDKLIELELSFFQNLIASRSGNILTIKDDNVLLTIYNLIENNLSGSPILVADGNSINDELIKQFNIKTDFIADKINQLKNEIYNETLAHYGILNPNINKKERVQVGELEAMTDFAYDNIYVIIDTANRDLEKAGLKTRLVFNGAIDDFTPNRDLNEQENEQENTQND